MLRTPAPFHNRPPWKQGALVFQPIQNHVDEILQFIHVFSSRITSPFPSKPLSCLPGRTPYNSRLLINSRPRLQSRINVPIHPTARTAMRPAMYVCSNRQLSIPRHPERSLYAFPKFLPIPLRPDPERLRKGERDLKRQREDRCE